MRIVAINKYLHFLDFVKFPLTATFSIIIMAENNAVSLKSVNLSERAKMKRKKRMGKRLDFKPLIINHWIVLRFLYY